MIPPNKQQADKNRVSMWPSHVRKTLHCDAGDNFKKFLLLPT